MNPLDYLKTLRRAFIVCGVLMALLSFNLPAKTEADCQAAYDKAIEESLKIRDEAIERANNMTQAMYQTYVDATIARNARLTQENIERASQVPPLPPLGLAPILTRQQRKDELINQANAFHREREIRAKTTRDDCIDLINKKA